MEECIVQQSELKPRRLIGRKEFLIMLIVSVVYAVFAYCNLGHAYAPQTFCKITQPVTIVFDRSEQISEIRYYGSIGQGNVEVCYSDDNEHYSVVPGEEGTLVFEYANKMLIIFQLFVPPVRLELTHYYYFIPVSKTGVSTKFHQEGISTPEEIRTLNLYFKP